MMRTFFALALAIAATTAAAAEPVPLGPLNLVPAPYAQVPLDLAANGDDFVAVWSDARSTLDLPPAPAVLAPALFDVRLNAAGVPASPAGRRLRTTAYNAKLAPRGGGYLLAYSDAGGMFTVALDADGAEIAAPKKIADTPGAGPLALATNGASFLLLQAHAVSILANDGSVVRTTPSAGFLDSSPVWPLGGGAYQFVAFRLECDGLVPCAGVTVLTTVSGAGGVTETILFELPQHSRISAALGNGGIVVASQSDDGGGSSVEYRLFDVSAHALRSAVRVASRPAACICGTDLPAVGWDGSEFLVVYQWTDLRAVRVTSTGGLLDSAPIVLDPAGGLPPLFARSAAGTTTLVWSSGNVATADLVSRTVRSFDELAGAVSRVVAKSFDLERGVQLADGPVGTLAVWREGYPNASILMSLAGRSAVALAPAGTVDLQAPAAARGRDAFLVAWREMAADAMSFRGVARRVAFDGTPLDAAPMVVAAETSSTPMQPPAISIASDGIDWLVVYPAAHATVRAARLSAAGALLDPAPILLTSSAAHFYVPAAPRVVWSGSRYVALWSENPVNPASLSPLPAVNVVYEARMTAAGQLIDTKEIWRGASVPDVALAAAPARLLAAWTDGTSLYTMFLGDDGTALTSPAVLLSESRSSLPDVDAAWDGSTFAIAWTARPSFDEAHIEYEHLGANGTPLEPAPLELEPELGTKYTPALARTQFGTTIAFHTLADTYVARAFATALPRAAVPPRRRATR